MCCENKSEYNPIDKTDEIFGIVKKYSPTAELIVGEDYRTAKGGRTIYAVNSSGKEMFIDIDTSEISLFFGGWHDHYYAEMSEYELFKENLNDIFNNKRFTVCTFTDNKPSCVCLSETEEPDIKSLREEFGFDTKIVCSFWDSSKNVTFDY